MGGQLPLLPLALHLRLSIACMASAVQNRRATQCKLLKPAAGLPLLLPGSAYLHEALLLPARHPPRVVRQHVLHHGIQLCCGSLPLLQNLWVILTASGGGGRRGAERGRERQASTGNNGARKALAARQGRRAPVGRTHASE